MTRIMIAGDSTAWGDHGDGTRVAGIATRLSQLFTNAGFPIDFVNVGQPGANYGQVADAMPAHLAANPDVAAVIVIAGLNDAAQGNGGPVSAITKESFRRCANAVLQFRADPNRVKLVAGMVAYCGPDPARPWLNIAIATANDGIWRSWYDWGFATWVPSLFSLTDMPTQRLGPDGVHPTEDGYSDWATGIYRNIQVNGYIPGLPPLPL